MSGHQLADRERYFYGPLSGVVFDIFYIINIKTINVCHIKYYDKKCIEVTESNLYFYNHKREKYANTVVGQL